MKSTPREGCQNRAVSGPFHKKQLSTSVNIRESGYKIVRSKSNRTEHSLSTKKPILITKNQITSSKKNLERQKKETPQTPINVRLNQGDKQYRTAETVAHFSQSIPSEKWSANEGKSECIGKGECCQLQCLQVIWQKVKMLKGRSLFAGELVELESILERMVLKLAQQENCLSNRSMKERSQLKATSESDHAMSGRVEELFTTIEEKNINIIIEGRESVKSSYDSLRIENEESHKLEYLDIYQAEDKLKDITNSCRHDSQSNSFSISSNSKGSTFRREEKPQWEDRIFLRSIVKRSKRDPNHQLKEDRENCCDRSTPAGNLSSINIAYECRMFECESNPKAPSSSGSSESKREVLNQIISMLNHKYQRSLKGDPGKVFI